MKTLKMERATLDSCISAAKSGRVLITRNGDPVALVVGLEGLDEEQIRLGVSRQFWKLIDKRRKEKTLSRAELEKVVKEKVGERNKRAASSGNREGCL